jgi:hypothetical protein
MTPETGRLPTFLVIGAMKAGTTSLYHYLRDHPQVFMPKVKELDFFAVETSWRRGLEWYERQFAGAGAAVAIGEASTAYTKYPHYPDVPERISQILPQCRMIYVVRNPIDRINSHYRHRVAVGAEREPMERALLDNRIYVDYSRYSMQIDRYLAHFRRDQLSVVTSDELLSDRSATVRRVYEFLGVDSDFIPSSIAREFYRSENRPVYPAAMWSIRRAIRQRFPAAKRAKELVDSLGRSVRSREGDGREERGQGSPARTSTVPIPDAVRKILEDRLRDDVRRLRGFTGPAFDGWGIA